MTQVLVGRTSTGRWTDAAPLSHRQELAALSEIRYPGVILSRRRWRPEARGTGDMYQLLVRFAGWQPTQDAMAIERTFKYTEDDLVARFKPYGVLDVNQLLTVPAVFATEINGKGSQYARIGNVLSVKPEGRQLVIRYSLDQSLPPIENRRLEKLASALGIQEHEFMRTHWAIKDIDLFAVLFRAQVTSPHIPKVFTVSSEVDDSLLAVMMPFDSSFANVYSTLQQCAGQSKLRCHRADDIWDHDAVIQDIVSLISRSRIVVCDCTNRNPNVFYEAGIAHALGRDVILIAQSESDIPFNLRHLRYIKYLNNAEGLAQLGVQVLERLRTLLDGVPS